jgi:predicted nucleic acid-binding Zn ribbon protein
MRQLESECIICGENIEQRREVCEENWICLVLKSGTRSIN